MNTAAAEQLRERRVMKLGLVAYFLGFAMMAVAAVWIAKVPGFAFFATPTNNIGDYIAGCAFFFGPLLVWAGYYASEMLERVRRRKPRAASRPPARAAAPYEWTRPAPAPPYQAAPARLPHEYKPRTITVVQDAIGRRKSGWISGLNERLDLDHRSEN